VSVESRRKPLRESCLVLAQVKPHRECVTAWTAALEGA